MKMTVSLTLFLGILVSLGTLNAAQEVYIRCYSGTLKKYITTPIDKPLGILPCIDKSKNTTIYTHGHIDQVDGPETTKMLVALLLLRNVNVLLLDYEREVPCTKTACYSITVAATKKISSIVGKALVILNEHGVRLDTMQLIGHGIGAHTMGWIGEEVQHLINKNISCIVGLEPAGQKFGLPIGLKGGLNPSQARFVIGVHTTKGQYGTDLSVGAVDFWANCAECENNQQQPGCEDDLCSYNRVVDIYAEAILDPTAFPAVFANSCSDWSSQKTSIDPINYLGDNSDPREPEKSLSFFFSTNARAPYSKGFAGIKPNSLTIN